MHQIKLSVGEGQRFEKIAVDKRYASRTWCLLLGSTVLTCAGASVQRLNGSGNLGACQVSFEVRVEGQW